MYSYVAPHPGFAHLWQQQELSDVDIVIIAAVAEGAASAGDSSVEEDDAPQQPVVLQQFPGHSSILSISKYCKAQALRWPSHCLGGSSSSNPDSSSATAHPQQGKPQIRLTLPDASYEAAAMAVLEALYFIKPVDTLLRELTQQQLLQAVVLADMWQAPLAGETALQLLTTAASSYSYSYSSAARGLDAAAAEHLLAMQAVPDCLQPLLRRTLLHSFGDLEAVWSDAKLVQSLLNLPMHAMEVLLASNAMKVASEDTVQYTAQAYVNNLRTKGLASADLELVQSKLAALVRCPHLSQFWLSAAVLSDDAPKLLLGGLQTQLKQLIMLQKAERGATNPPSVLAKRPDSFIIKADVPGAPASWLLPLRTSKAVSSVTVEWSVDVADIKAAAQATASTHAVTSIGRSSASPPLLGISWCMVAECAWRDVGRVSLARGEKPGTVMNVAAAATNLPAGTVCKAAYSLECVGLPSGGKPTHRFKPGRAAVDWLNCFRIGPMSDGFDEAVWVAKGLPTSGQVVFRLTVKDVGQ